MSVARAEAVQGLDEVLHGEERMQASGILMRRSEAELAVPVLDRALANVLDVTLSADQRPYCEAL